MSLSERLNHDPTAFRVDGAELFASCVAHLGQPGVAPSVSVANAPFFVDAAVLDELRELISTILRVSEMPSYRGFEESRTDALSPSAPPTLGVFYGFDFHLGPDGPRLIEINTNAGGAMLLAHLEGATRRRLPDLDTLPLAPGWPSAGPKRLLESFSHEFARACPDRPLHSVAIVDETPTLQYLYTEFLLFREALRAAGIRAEILAPTELEWTGAGLAHAGQHIDLVYNRLVDFGLESPEHALLAKAVRGSTTVVSPGPVHHARLADKRRLAELSNPEHLGSLGVPDDDTARLVRLIPTTRVLAPGGTELSWQDRKEWFFKPWAGYGSRAAYRGDKLTRATFERIAIEGGYVAQKLVVPSRRWVATSSGTAELAADLRAFVCDGEVVLFGARLYRGQTTNMRTEGGGFATVIPLSSSTSSGS